MFKFSITLVLYLSTSGISMAKMLGLAISGHLSYFLFIFVVIRGDHQFQVGFESRKTLVYIERDHPFHVRYLLN